MMYSTLSEFDPVTAAGILARAALFVADDSNPAAHERIQGERKIRQEILGRIRESLGISNDDNSPETLELIGDALDAESESLVRVADMQKVLGNLSKEGFLPSDLFDIVIVRNIEEFHGRKFSNEKKLIEITIKSPEQEQHYGEPVGPGEPFLISLFSKFIPNQYPLRSFTMLVACQRNGLQLVVHQAWRVYSDLVDLRGVTDLVGMLERFSNAFGAEVVVGEQKGHFIKAVELKKGEHFPPDVQIPISRVLSGKKIKNPLITVSYFFQKSPIDENNKAALVVAINLDRYEDALKVRGW